MSIDTAARRRAASGDHFPAPDGSIGADDRRQAGGFYARHAVVSPESEAEAPRFVPGGGRLTRHSTWHHHDRAPIYESSDPYFAKVVREALERAKADSAPQQPPTSTLPQAEPSLHETAVTGGAAAPSAAFLRRIGGGGDAPEAGAPSAQADTTVQLPELATLNRITLADDEDEIALLLALA